MAIKLKIQKKIFFIPLINRLYYKREHDENPPVTSLYQVKRDKKKPMKLL